MIVKTKVNLTLSVILLILTTTNSSILNAQTSDPCTVSVECLSGGEFRWADTLGDGAIWNSNDSLNTYSVTTPNGPVLVSVTLIDPLNRNGDSNQFNIHPYDPAGGCEPYPGASGSSESDNVPGNGSITDPWDSDCNFLMTETNGVFGAGYLSFGISTVDHTDEVSLEFEFDKPIILENFTISDIDALGFYNAVIVNNSEYEVTGDSYQDEVIVSAISPCGSEVDLCMIGGENIIIRGDTLSALYQLGVNNNVGGNSPVATAMVSSTSAISKLILTYSNGKEDADAEQEYPELYEWWSLDNGPTNGNSDDQAIRLDGFTFCCCPELTPELTSNTVCSNRMSTIMVESVSGGSGPYHYEWPDGSTLNSFEVSAQSDTTVNLIVTDASCCKDTVSLDLVSINCCDGPNCVGITATKN